MSLLDRETQNTNLENNDNITPKETKSGTSTFTKIKLFFIGIVVLFGGSVVGFSIYEDAHTIVIDNPTNENISVKIDNNGTELKISPGTSQDLKIENGKHNVFLNGKDIGSFQKETMDMRPLINPTLSEYVIEQSIYTNNPENYEKLPNNDTKFLGEDLKGPFEVYNSLYINNTWDYDLNETLPEEVSLSKHSSYKIVKKIYRPQDFIIMYNNTYASDEDGSGTTSTGSEVN